MFPQATNIGEIDDIPSVGAKLTKSDCQFFRDLSVIAGDKIYFW